MQLTPAPVATTFVASPKDDLAPSPKDDPVSSPKDAPVPRASSSAKIAIADGVTVTCFRHLSFEDLEAVLQTILLLTALPSPAPHAICSVSVFRTSKFAKIHQNYIQIRRNS